ncbi:MAG: BatD family protein [Planctomycetes bacterium]|nr:BatD family protein [Planctomycetota bacterium]
MVSGPRAWCVVALAGALPAQAPDLERAFVEVEPLAAEVWLHEAIELRVRVGIDAEWFRAAALPLFRQPLDQPFHLVVPWLLGAEDRAVVALPPAPTGAMQRLAVGDQVVAAAVVADRTRDGRRFEVLELRYRWLPLAAGTSTIAPVELRYAYATRFEADFLRGRQPGDRRDHSVLSMPGSLRVRALPQAGRPEGFAGAVGEFQVTATVAAATVAVGDTIAVEVAVRGDGNLDRMAPLPPPRLPGFHVLGVRERRGGEGRTFLLDVLALRPGLGELPAIPFAAFSPRQGGYVVHRTAPVPLRVLPAPPGTVLPPAVAALVQAEAAAAAARPWWEFALVGLVVAAGVAGWGLGRARQRWQRRLAHALATLAAGGSAEALRTAVEAACAARVRAGVFDGEVWTRLVAVGVGEEAVARLRAVHAALDAARFGGVAPAAGEVVAAARVLAGR